MRSFLSALTLMRPACGIALAAAMGLSAAHANTAPQTTQSAGAAAQATLSVLPEATSRNLTCETLLETAGYQQAALQSVVEKHAVAAQAGQPAPELEKMVQDSQARLDQTQGQINTACAA